MTVPPYFFFTGDLLASRRSVNKDLKNGIFFTGQTRHTIPESMQVLYAKISSGNYQKSAEAVKIDEVLENKFNALGGMYHVYYLFCASDISALLKVS